MRVSAWLTVPGLADGPGPREVRGTGVTGGIRPGLPYGAVMATGAASDLAGRAGLGFIRLPLLWLTVTVALAVPAWRAARQLREGADIALPRPPRARLGVFTVPIGLAVIGGGLAQLDEPAAQLGALCAVSLAWAATMALIVVVLVPMAASWPGTQAVDGTWFLAPAALLADAIGVAGIVGRSTATPAQLLGWLALMATGLGALGYVVVAVLAIARLAAGGLAGSARASWWIAAGCAGLTAAALCRTSEIGPVHGSAVTPWLAGTAVVFWGAGSLALIPVVIGSARFVAQRRLHGPIPWPPTFSTGVYAIGAAQVGRLAGLPAVTTLSGIAAAATVVLWVFSAYSRVRETATLAAVPR